MRSLSLFLLLLLLIDFPPLALSQLDEAEQSSTVAVLQLQTDSTIKTTATRRHHKHGEQKNATHPPLSLSPLPYHNDVTSVLMKSTMKVPILSSTARQVDGFDLPRELQFTSTLETPQPLPSCVRDATLTSMTTKIVHEEESSSEETKRMEHDQADGSSSINRCNVGQGNDYCGSWTINVVIALSKTLTTSSQFNSILLFIKDISSSCTSASKIAVFMPSNMNHNCSATPIDTNNDDLFVSLKLEDVIITNPLETYDTIRNLYDVQANCTHVDTVSVLILVFTDSNFTDFCNTTEVSFPSFNPSWVTRIYYREDWNEADAQRAFHFANCGAKKEERCQLVKSSLDNLHTLVKETRTCPVTENIQIYLIIFGVLCFCMSVVALGCTYFCYKKSNIRWRKFFLREQLQKQNYTIEEIKAMGLSPGNSLKKKQGSRKLYSAQPNHYSEHRVEAEEEFDEWEIAAGNLLVLENKILGHGAFATVCKGILKGRAPLLDVHPSLKLDFCHDPNDQAEVAVKKLPPHADVLSRRDFQQEIHFMKNLGYHRHVTSLLGCVTRPQESLLVVEFCHHGDLLNFLRAQKKHVLVDEMGECPLDAELCLRIKDLVSITWQISDGMTYLSSLNFIHRDLAARNVLLTKSLVAKISDFGLGRHVDSSLYMAKGGRLPIKWMPPEALKYNEFSQKSDVWSFGVLLYEVFSLGKTPFPTVQPFEMIQHLENGGRLPQTPLCPNQIYSLITSCGALIPDKRPTFEEIKSHLSILLNTNDEKYGYLDLTKFGGELSGADVLDTRLDELDASHGEDENADSNLPPNEEVDWMYLKEDESSQINRSRSASEGGASLQTAVLRSSQRASSMALDKTKETPNPDKSDQNDIRSERL